MEYETEIDYAKQILSFTGELNPELKVEQIYPGFHTEDEKYYENADLTIQFRFDVKVKDLPELFQWMSRNSEYDAFACSIWKLTLTRLDAPEEKK